MDKVNQRMKQFTIRGVLAGLRNTVTTPSKSEVEIEESLRSEHFQVAKIVRHGFPFQPTAMAYDPIQNLLAIGSKSGSLRIFGRPGVDCAVKHDTECSILQIQFLVNEGAMVTVCDDDQVHLWTLRQKRPTIIHSLRFQRERITYCHLPFQSKWLYIGTERGNVHIVNIESFVVSGYIINWNKAIELARKTHPGPVVHLSDNPCDTNKLLIGFESGAIVMWDLKNKTAEARYNCAETLRSISWHHEGKQFMCSHGDGSLTLWNYRNPGNKPLNVMMPHAKLGKDGKPEPCRPIPKVDWRALRTGEAYIIFSGGMPYDKASSRTPSLTVMHAKNTTVLEMEHNVVDFLTLCPTPWNNDFQDPYAIVVLLQNDLVVVDLTSPGYPCFENPYPMDIHESPVTACLYYADCPPDLIPAFYSVGSKQKKTGFSEKEWPIKGGEWGTVTCSYPEIMITGHADGSIKFWDASAVTLQVLYKLKTAKVFDKSKCRSPDLEDDPFAIQHMYLCAESRLLCVAGCTHVILFRFCKQESNCDIQNLEISVSYEIYDEMDSPELEYPPVPPKPSLGSTQQSGSLGSYSSNTSEGKETAASVRVKSGSRKWSAGYQPDLCCILTWIDGDPAPPITSLSLNSSYGLLAFGNEYGIAIVDLIQQTCLLNMGTPDLYGSNDPYARAPRSPKNKQIIKPQGMDTLAQPYNTDECKSPTTDQLTLSLSQPKLQQPCSAGGSGETFRKVRHLSSPSSSKSTSASYERLASCPSSLNIIRETTTTGTCGDAAGEEAGQQGEEGQVDNNEEFNNNCFVRHKEGFVQLGSVSSAEEAVEEEAAAASEASSSDSSSDDDIDAAFAAASTEDSQQTAAVTPDSNDEAQAAGGDVQEVAPLNQPGDASTQVAEEEEDKEHRDADKHLKNKARSGSIFQRFLFRRDKEAKHANMDVDASGLVVCNISEFPAEDNNETNNSAKVKLTEQSAFSFPPAEVQVDSIGANKEAGQVPGKEDVDSPPSSPKGVDIQKGVLEPEEHAPSKHIIDAHTISSAKKHRSDSDLHCHLESMKSSTSTVVETSVGASDPAAPAASSLSPQLDSDHVDAKPPRKESFVRKMSKKIRHSLVLANTASRHRHQNAEPDVGEPEAARAGSRKSKFEVIDLTPLDVAEVPVTVRVASYRDYLLMDKADGSFSRSRSSSMSSLENIKQEAIQCLTFADSYSRKSDSAPVPCLWVGTSLGSALVISISLPEEGDRQSQPVIVSPSGTIFRLKGSILAMSFLDCNGILIQSLAEQWQDPNRSSGERRSPYNRQQSVSSMKSRMSPTSSTELPADRQFAIMCSEKQARVVSLPNQTCAYKVKITETSIVTKAEVISLKDSVCLAVCVANGHIMTFSLPSLKPIMDVDYLPSSDVRVAKTFCFSSNGHAMYFTSPTEVQKLTLSAETCENLSEMLGELFLPCDTPEAPKQGFFKTLFTASPAMLDREELFGEGSGKASMGVAKYMAGTAGMASTQERAGAAMSEIGRAKMAAIERGERLGELDERSAAMRNEAESYGRNAHDIMAKYRDKKWYQF